MRCFLKVLTLVCLSVGVAAAQQQPADRQPILNQTAEPRSQLKRLAAEYLEPDKTDLAEALEQGLEVFRILPRGMFDYEENVLSVRGGGAYYSFVSKSHNYNSIPQIQLEKDNFSVGFYGANFGLIADLGETPLASMTPESRKLNYLLNYQAPREEALARAEYRRISSTFEIDKLKYQRMLPAVVGHTYILRAISFDEADTLVALQVRRKDADGSLIVFWKLIENFEKPELVNK